MAFELTILGASSAKPAYGRHTTSQLLSSDDFSILIDAGEFVQAQISKFRLKPSRIKYVVLSHNHGDHILGLPGFLGSLSLNQRKTPLTIFAQPGVKEWFEKFVEISESHYTFDLQFKNLNVSGIEKIIDEDDLEVHSFPVVHRVPTCGFLFKQKKQKIKLDAKAIQRYNLSYEEIRTLKNGGDLNRKEAEITKDVFIESIVEPRSYAYCADTLKHSSYMEYIQNVNLLYHEATYLENLQDKAIERMHSTATDAAKVAREVGAEKLIIGHYSSRYKALDDFLFEAKRDFENVNLAIEGEKHII